MLRNLVRAVFGLALSTGLAVAQTTYVGKVRHAPSINGTVQGSLQQMLGESVTFNGGANVTGDFYVIGTPTVQMNGTPTYGGTLQGNGSTSPSNYYITLNSGASLNHVVRRTNAITWPTVSTVPAPSGTASVTVNSSGQSINWATLRDLTLNSGVGQIVVPAGTYGNFNANTNSGFTLGTAGATTPSVYNFQNLTLNSISKLLVVGPVIINLANGFSANSTVGASTNPVWLTLNIKSGGLTLNSGCNVYGYVLAPGGTVIINNSTQLVGGVTSDYLTVNGGGLLKLQAPQTPNQPPTVTLTAPANGSSYTSPASITLAATASDSDGTVTKVEFFLGTTELGEDTTAPYSINLTGVTAGSYSYFARATDNTGATTDSAAVSVTVTNPNQPPTITLTEPADGTTFTAPATVAVSATAADPDGSVTRVDFYQGATLIGSDTTAPYGVTTSTLSAGVYVFSAIAVDNNNATATSTTPTITVVNPNQPPTVSISAPADGTSYDDPAGFTVTASAADADGYVVKVVFFQNGVLQGEDLTAPFSFAVSGLTPGTYDFVARATDNIDSSTDSAPVRITVAHVNDAPVANDQSLVTNEDTALSIILTATDSDGDPVSYSIVAQPSFGSLSGTAPSLTYTPAANFYGTDSFTFKASDGSLDSMVATVTITVIPINDPPVAVPKSLIVAEDSSGQVHLTGVDIDSAGLQFVVTSGPDHGSLSGSLPDLTYTPAPNYHGPDGFTYTAFDGEFISAPAQVTITVTPGNVAPTANAAAVATDEDVPVAVVLAGTDGDGDALTYSVATTPTHGTLSGTAPSLTYTPAANYHGPDAFTFTVSDAEFTSAPATVTLTVSSINDEPIALSQSVSTVEDTALPVLLTAVEIDEEDTLTYSVVVPPAHGTLSGTAPSLTYTPAANYHGPDSFTFKAHDGTTDSASATVSIEVTPFNDAPYAGSLALDLVEDVPVAFDLPAVDVDDDPLTYTIITAPMHGVLSGTAPSLVYTPNANYYGADEFSYKVSDGALESGPALVTFEVTPVNDTPLGADITVPLDEDTAAGFVLPGTDVDGDALTFAIVGAPQHGVLSGLAPNLVYTPVANFNGSDALTYTVSDGALVSAVYTVTFVVAPVNDAPVADAKSLLTDEDTPVSVSLTGNDIDGDSLTFAVATPPNHGALGEVSPGIFTYTPAPNYNGPDSFTYVANDAAASSAPALVTIAVAPVNDAPVAAVQSVVTPEDTAIVITLAGSDVDGDALSYAISSNPAHGTLTPVTANTYSYTPAPNYHGPDSFAFSVSDGALQSAQAIVAIEITPVNDAPVASGQSLVTDEDTALPFTLTATDVDGDALTYTVQSQPAHGTLSGSAPNLVYTPAANYHGPDSFTFTASDGTLSTAVATVLLTINSVNDAPVAAGQNVTTAEDTAVPVTLTASDVDGDSLAYVITTPPVHGTLTGTGANRTYTPAADYHGSDSFTFMASDGSLSSPDALVLINITPVNDAPVAQAATYSITTGTPLALTLAGTDVDGDTLTYSLVTQPTHGTLAGTPPGLTYTSAPDFGGFDALTFKVNDGTVDSAPATVQFTTGLPPRSRSYTTTEDFTAGALISVSTEQADQLSNKLVLSSFDAVWVANSSKGTVVKIEPETARVIGEYHAKPVDAAAPYPSRVAVDSRGNVWVANYSHNSIVKIGLPENGYWVDRNGNGQIDTSGALGDVRDWDADNVAAADDEAILLYVRTAVNGVRHISIDSEDNVWVGGPADDWQKFDGRTGALLRTEASVGKGGMGGYIAGNGKLYSSGTDFLIWQTADGMAALPESGEVRLGSWASALDSQGNLWVTKDWTSTVIKYAPDGTKLGEYYHGEPWAMGIAIDANDHLWIAHSHCGHSVGHMLPDGTLLGNVEVANHGPVEVSIDRRGRIWVVSSTGVVERINPLGGPLGVDGETPVGEIDLTTGNLGGSLWTYGRFTGTGFGLTSPDGFWTFVYDGILSGSTWGPVVWNALLANDGNVLVEAALSSNGVTYGPYQPLTFGNSTPTGAGRYLKIRTRLVSATTGESPLLYDLSVGTEGYAPPAVPQYWDISAGEDIKGNWPDKIQLKGVFRHTVHDFSVQPAYAWTLVSGPGTVTFNDATRLRPEAQFSIKGDYVLRLTATLGAQVTTADVQVSLEPYNRAPYANAGYTTFRADLPPEIWLWGEVRDDGLPNGATVTSSWEKLFGPGTVAFTDPTAPTTKASFSAPGVYVLRLNATDTELTGSDVTTVWLGYPCIPVAPEGLVAWWQASGNGDDHVGGNQAFTSGGTGYAEGRTGGAFSFDGVNDRVRIFASPGLDAGRGDGFSVELWVNPDTSRTATILEYSAGSPPGFNLRQVGAQLDVDFREANGTSHVLSVGGALPVATWTHVAASYDKATGEARVYVNGLLRISQSIGSFVLGTNLDVNFGGRPSSVESFDGLLDEVSIYDRAIYADEVATIFNHPAGKRPPVANVAPIVEIPPALFGSANTPVALNATVTDDGQPIDGVLTSHWSKVSGPGVVTFGSETAPQTTATFSEGGVYTLRLLADDGGFCTEKLVEVRVGALYKYDTGLEVAAWWTGNDTDLDAVHGLKLERFNGLAYAAGEASSGFSFDGADDFGKVPASAFTNIGASALGLTMEFWLKPGRQADGQALMVWGDANNDGVRVWQHGNGNGLAVWWKTTTGTEPLTFINGGVFPIGQWTHVAITYDKQTGFARVYQNGVMIREENVGIFTPQTSYPVTFGANRLGTGNLYQGVLDEVSFYSRPLTLAEVQAIYQGDVSGKVTLDDNLPPVINAGPDKLDVAPGAVVLLNGTVTDDGRPLSNALSISWSKVGGPGVVEFANSQSADTTATFSATGTYTLRLDANDGLNQGLGDTMVVRVGVTASVEPDGALAAWWPANGEIHEVVHGNHDIEFLPRGPAFATGEVGQGFDFNGTDHYGRVPAHSDLDIGASALGLTIEFWAKPTRSADSQALLVWGDANNDGVRVWQHGGGNGLIVWWRATTGSEPPYTFINGGVFPIGQWTHVAITYDKQTGFTRVYRNGVLIREENTGIFTPQTSYPVTFGANRLGTGNIYQGVLDEVSFYTRPLALADIQAIYSAGVSGKAPLDDNLPPVVNAGPDVTDLNPTATIALNGTVTDDGRPVGYPLTITWSKVEGPGTVSFTDATTAATTATFSAAGTYVLQLSARDAQHTAVPDTMVVRVGVTASVEPDGTLAAWWPGNGDVHEMVHGNHDIEFLPRGPAFATGEVGQGFDFNGTDHYGRVPAHSDLNIGASDLGLTMEFWVKPGRQADAQAFMVWGDANNDGVRVWQYGNGNGLIIWWRTTTGGEPYTFINGGVFTIGQWTHVAITYDKQTGFARVYRNGVLIREENVGIFTPQTSYPVAFGANRTGNSNIYQGVLDEVSFYTRPLALADIQAIYSAGVSGKAPLPQNLSPTVLLDSPVPSTSYVINSPITLAAIATDADGTIAKVEFYDGVTKIAETTTADVGQPTRFSFVLPTGLALGQHVLSARATDDLGAVTSSSSATIFVVPVLPVVSLTAPVAGADLVTGAPLTVEATATYSLGAITKVEFYSGTALLGTSTLSSPNGSDTFTFTLTAGLPAGTHTLTAKATAGGFSATSAPVGVTSQVVLPVVAVTSPANGSTIVADVPVALTAAATTAQGTITKVEFFNFTTKLGERIVADSGQPSTFTFTLASGFPAGAHSLTAKATSSTAATATSTPVSITAGAYMGDPDVLIIAPAEDARISAPTSVTGVVAIPSLTSWALDYRLKVADGDPVEAWVQFATGSNLVGTPEVGASAAIPGALGTFDPTSLINGIYEIQLRATDASATTTTAGPITLVVEGNMKVGAFTLAFEDLKVPVAGIPITLTRTYDSRDARVGDFGPGWRLAVANVRVQKNRNLGANWYQTLQSGSGIQFYYVDPLSQPVVTVTMPDGESHRFRGGALVKVRPGDPDNASFAVVADDGLFKFYPLGDTTSTLEPVDAAGALDEHFYIHGTGDQDLRTGDESDPFSPTYNPTRFRLTTKDGTRYLLDERLGLLRLEDLNGNTLVLNRDAQNRVTSVVSTLSSQPLAPSTVTIHRDATGRVDYIRDLGGKDLDYLYDTSGRLASFTNRELNTTQFFYENATFPNYLTKILDPRGIAALRSEFDAAGKLVKQIDADGKETVFDRGINAGVRFEKVTDRLGHATTFYYDDRGNVTTKLDALGAQTTYSYYADTDRVRFETDHYGNTKSMAYDARGNVTVETMGANASEDPANPTTGYITRTTYNALSAPTQITDPSGRVQTFAYDPVTNNLLSNTVGAGGPAPATTTYTYNTDGTLGTITDALGNVTSHTYNYAFSNAVYPGAVKQITVTVTDPAGAAGSDSSNASATVLRTSSTLYDGQENMLATIATRTIPGVGSEDVVTKYLYDSENRLKATVMSDGKVSETRYTSFGQTDKSLLWRTLADYQSGNTVLARVTSYGYDNRGNQTSTIYPDGTSESSSLDLENRREWSQDKLGRKTYFQYDNVGRLRFTFQPDATPGTLANNPYTETVYDLSGRVTDTYDELRHRTTVVYFPDGTPDAGRRKQSVQVLGTGNLTTTYAYDASGNVRFVTDPRGNTVETQYDTHGRPTTVIYPATDEHPVTQSVTKYNVLGQRTEIVDQEGKVMRYRYDGLGRLFEVRQYIDQALAASDTAFSLSPTATGVAVTRYTHDEMGNQLTQTDARANTTNYRYDSLGRRTSRILPDNATESLQYDEWGNLWKRTDFKGYTTTFLYDTLNRLTEKRADPTHPSLIYSHAPDKISYGYDAAGNRIDALVEKGSTALYAEDTPVDERNRRLFKDTALGKLTYAYYANSLLQGITSSNTDGVLLGYRYDEANRLAFVDDGSSGTLKTTSYTYNANGSLATVTAPNTIRHTYVYDTLNRLRTLTVGAVALNSPVLHAYEYKLKASGHRQQVLEGAKTTTYTYDDLYRLTNEAVTGDTHGNNGSVGYTLDKVGNRESRASSIAAVAAATNSFNSRDWLSGDTYDASGNTTLSLAFNTQPDVYDFEDRLIIRRKLDGSTVNLSYDADGLLRQKTVFNSALTLVSATGYLQDTMNPTGYAQIMEERINAAAGTTVKLYAYGSDLISQLSSLNSQPATLSYFSYDGLGSVRELTNASGAITDAYDYDAFGILVYRVGTTDNAYLYRGERFESDIGQYYLRARFYNQNTGRFWNQDSYEGSASDPMSLHKYLYANADPVMFSDPSGHLGLAELSFAQFAFGNLLAMTTPSVASTGRTAFTVNGITYYSEWPIGPHLRSLLAASLAIAHTMMGNAIKDLNSVATSGSASAEYQYYFGNYGTSWVDTVRTNFEAIRTAMNNGKLSFRNLTKSSPEYEYAKDGRDNVAAWVTVADRMNLQTVFWTWESPEERAATMIHEMSHYAADTNDILGYNKQKLHDHAQFTPVNAIKTASNYERYAQEFYP